jgi:hypothetical protein
MNRKTGPDEKQRELPLFIEDPVAVPNERRTELEGALAELLLGVANADNAERADGGSK